MCIYLFQIIIHIQIVTETEEVGWVMEGTVCAEGYTFYGKINYLLWTGFFIHHSTILGVKGVELVSDRMLHIVMGGCR
jgi:hypothetical protein